MLGLLQQAVEAEAIRPLDVQFATFFADDKQPRLALILAWLSAEAGAGHVCLPLSQLNKGNLFNGRHPELANEIWLKAGEPQPDDWRQVLLQSPAVSDGSQPTPLVLEGDRLYLQRMWQDEGEVAAFFSQPDSGLFPADHRLRDVLTPLFPLPTAADEIDWQKVAAAVAASRRVAVISGGPGTGKTTTVARLLAALIQTSDKSGLRIALAAPTGKAAARLTESLAQASQSITLSDSQRALMPQEASTLHRLLGVQPNSSRLRHHRDNPLHLDVLVVDEASMVDLPMMARLIAALPDRARLILLGDRDQLASVEAGAVLGDICRYAEQGYSPERAEQLSELTGFAIPACSLSQAVPVRDSLCLLRKSYRFQHHSGIGQLAMAINQGNVKGALACFQQDFNDIERQPLASADDYLALINSCVAGYREYLQIIHHAEPEKVLAMFGQFQLLCALRSGPFGVTGLNERIEQALLAARLIKRNSLALNPWYAGRPVMVNRNDSSLGLYNGDIGIALLNDIGEMRVYFQQSNGSVKSIQPNRLPLCETAFAMTVHKSQGSEFDHTLLVLPDSYSPLISRELIYTAVTRARRRLTLFANDDILSMAIRKPTERRSGLAERLINVK